jgi:hypothetical protein
MYEELGSVQQPVELSPTEALTSAEELLRRQGYRIIHRTRVMVVGKRENLTGLASRKPVHLAVCARPHPGGGLTITLQGDDREGVRERQGEWSRWAEGLPKIGPWEKKEHQGESGQQETEVATTAETGRRPLSGEREAESHAGQPPGREVQPQLANRAREGKGRDKSSDRGPGAWTSVAPWERKMRIAPGKVDEKSDKPR